MIHGVPATVSARPMRPPGVDDPGADGSDGVGLGGIGTVGELGGRNVARLALYL